MMQRTDWQNWLRLSQVAGLSRATARQLLNRFGGVQALFAQSSLRLGECLPPSMVDALLTPPPHWPALCERTETWLSEAPTERAIWSQACPHYPPGLLDLDDAPLMVYVQGQLHWPQGPAVAVVGSRNPSPQGLYNAEQFGEELCLAGLCVVSGLALGVDGAAHRGALKGALQRPGVSSWPTLAVLGHGLDQVYPRQHRGLAEGISAHGLLLSEFSLGEPPRSHHFPLRNRLIAALAQGTLVIEAAPLSGSLITAHQALELGREVMAIPGSIHAPQARGCHSLIRQGAALIERTHDVLEALGQCGLPLQERPPSAPASAEEAALLTALGHESSSLDQLVQRTGWDPDPLLAHLLRLEMAGRVRREQGNRYQALP